MHYAILKEVLGEKEGPLSYEEIRHLINEADRLGVKRDLSNLDLSGCKFDFDVSNTNFNNAKLNDTHITHVQNIKGCSFKDIGENTVIHFTAHNGTDVSATIKEWNDLIKKKYIKGKSDSATASAINWQHNEGYLDKISNKSESEKFFATIEYASDPKRPEIKKSSTPYRSLGHSFTTEAFHLAVAHKEHEALFPAKEIYEDKIANYIEQGLQEGTKYLVVDFNKYDPSNDNARLNIKNIQPGGEIILKEIFAAIAQKREILFAQTDISDKPPKTVHLIDVLTAASAGNPTLTKCTEQLKIFCDWLQTNRGLKSDEERLAAINEAKKPIVSKGFFGKTEKPGKLGKIDEVYMTAITAALQPAVAATTKKIDVVAVKIPTSARSNKIDDEAVAEGEIPVSARSNISNSG